MTPRKKQPTPGEALVASLTETFELESFERELVALAGQVYDTITGLQAIVAAEGPMVKTKAGEARANPALVELRLQQLVFGRLISTLRFPESPAGARPQGRGARGTYRLRGVPA